jgi:hypothetical protein
MATLQGFIFVLNLAHLQTLHRLATERPGKLLIKLATAEKNDKH